MSQSSRAIVTLICLVLLGPPVGGILMGLAMLVAAPPDPASDGFIRGAIAFLGLSILFSYIMGGFQAVVGAIWISCRIVAGALPGRMEAMAVGGIAALPATFVMNVVMGSAGSAGGSSLHAPVVALLALLGMASAAFCHWLLGAIGILPPRMSATSLAISFSHWRGK